MDLSNKKVRSATTFYVAAPSAYQISVLHNSTIMPKTTSKSVNRKSFLKCQYCWQVFLRGRSYSNHIIRCGALSAKQDKDKQQQIAPSNPRITTTITADQRSSESVNDDISDTTSDSYALPDINDDNNQFHILQDDGENEDDSLSFVGSEISDPDSINDKESSLLFLHTHSSNNAEALGESLCPQQVGTQVVVATSDTTSTSLLPAFHCFTTDDVVQLSLLNLCHRLQAPQYAFDEIMSWSQDAKLAGYSFPSNASSRKTFLEQLYLRFNMKNIKPIQTEVALQPNKVATVVTFSFPDMVQSLVDDHSLFQRSNLLNPNDVVDTDNIGDIHTGSWFKKAAIHLCVNGNDVLCPIILFIDKTQIDTYSKWTLEPVLFTLGLFNRSTRNLSQAWRPLGLVTNTIRMSSATQAESTKQVRSIAKLACFQTVLSLPNPVFFVIHRALLFKTTIAFYLLFFRILLLPKGKAAFQQLSNWMDWIRP